MSRNKERVGATQPDATPPVQNTSNPATGGAPFSFVIPTEFVELPSEGRYYAEGHPLHNQSSLEIKQMTAKEEDILTSRTLLKKGVALDRVIRNIIVDKSIDPDSLLVGDRNAIIIATRVAGYGADYSTKVSCPNCAEMQEYTFDLNEAIIYDGNDTETMSLTYNNDGTFNVQLPQTKLDITFRLLNGYDETRVAKAMEREKKTKKTESLITQQLRSILVAVNDNSEPEALNYVISNIPSRDSRHLRLAYKSAAPNVDLTQNFDCEVCDYSADMEVPLGAEFFWPDR